MDGNGLDEAVVESATRLGVRDGLVFRRLSRTSWAHLGGFGRGRGWAGSSRWTRSATPSSGTARLPRATLTRVANTPSARVLGPYYCVGGALVRVTDDVLVVLGNPLQPAAGQPPRRELLELARRAGVRRGGGAGQAAGRRARAAARRPRHHQPAGRARRRGTQPRAQDRPGVAVLRGGCHPRRPRPMGPLGRAVRPGHRQLSAQGDAGPPGGAVPARARSASRTPRWPTPSWRRSATPTAYGPCSPWPSPSRSAACWSSAHTLASPRGFTALCVEMGKHIADAATVVAHTAALREELREAAEQHASLARLDPLTGLGNRLAWDEALVARPRSTSTTGAASRSSRSTSTA